MASNRWQERDFIEQVAAHHHRVQDPAGVVDSVWLSNEGLEMTSTGWWNSAPALDHQIRLGLALAHRVRSVRGY